MPSWWRVAAPVLAAVLLVKMGGSSLEALRYSRVGPKDHLMELRDCLPRAQALLAAFFDPEHRAESLLHPFERGLVDHKRGFVGDVVVVPHRLDHRKHEVHL